MTGPEVSPAVRDYLDALNDRQVDISEIRRRRRELNLRACGPAEAAASVVSVDAGGAPARLYTQSGEWRGVLVWLHGGGWKGGEPEDYDVLARVLATRAPCALLYVDYRLAPRHPFPAALEDSWAAVRWAAERYDLIAVGGDSAGGTLAAAVALRARDIGLDLALQVLVYPLLDYGLVDGPAYREWADRYRGSSRWERWASAYVAGNRAIWEEYIPDPEDRLLPEASPLRSSSLRDLAPALLIQAEHDLLRAEGEEYAARLAKAGVEARLVTYRGQIHGFFHLPGLFDEALDAIGVVGRVVHSCLHERLQDDQRDRHRAGASPS